MQLDIVSNLVNRFERRNEMNSYKRPLPKGSVIESVGTQATVVFDKGLEVVVKYNGKYGLWDWKLGSNECKVISIPQIQPVE